MRLTKDEFINCVKTFKEMYDEESNILNALDSSPDWKPGNWVINYYNMMSMLCDFTEEQYEDVCGTPLDYYCWELDFGTSENSDIKSVDDLYEYIIKHGETHE